ncbi:hypothetical protein TUSST3_20700 [Streptomyces sp. TUS-ST3]|nr:hypothetical protein TUSST3_20700 [Streptomyces sp. TUS-ST3]
MLVRVPQRGPHPLQLQRPQRPGVQPFPRVQQLRRIRHRNVPSARHVVKSTDHSVEVLEISNPADPARSKGCVRSVRLSGALPWAEAAPGRQPLRLGSPVWTP